MSFSYIFRVYLQWMDESARSRSHFELNENHNRSITIILTGAHTQHTAGTGVDNDFDFSSYCNTEILCTLSIFVFFFAQKLYSKNSRQNKLKSAPPEYCLYNWRFASCSFSLRARTCKRARVRSLSLKIGTTCVSSSNTFYVCIVRLTDKLLGSNLRSMVSLLALEVPRSVETM